MRSKTIPVKYIRFHKRLTTSKQLNGKVSEWDIFDTWRRESNCFFVFIIEFKWIYSYVKCLFHYNQNKICDCNYFRTKPYWSCTICRSIHHRRMDCTFCRRRNRFGIERFSCRKWQGKPRQKFDWYVEWLLFTQFISFFEFLLYFFYIAIQNRKGPSMVDICDIKTTATESNQTNSKDTADQKAMVLYDPRKKLIVIIWDDESIQSTFS